jgi:uncharacterized protein (DUF2062 family)
MRAIVLGSLAAILVQPFVYVLWGGIAWPAGGPAALPALMGALEAVAATAAAFVAVLWVPFFLLLRWLGRTDRATILSCGVLIAAVPGAVRGWPLATVCGGCSSAGRWHGHFVQFEASGVLTRYAWLRYLEGVALYGVHGLVGALAFYVVWRRSADAATRRRDRAP